MRPRLLISALWVFLAILQVWSLSVGDITLHYIFFSIIEIMTCLFIAAYAWRWKESGDGV